MPSEDRWENSIALGAKPVGGLALSVRSEYKGALNRTVEGEAMPGPLDIVLLPGDGVGVEVMREGRKVLDVVLEASGLTAEVEEIPCGGLYYLAHGADWPPYAADRCREADVMFLGSVGWPDPHTRGPVTMKDGNMAGWSPVIGNRRALELYANVRPVRLYRGVEHTIHGRRRLIWDPDQVDMMFVRENTEGLYTAIGGRVQSAGADVVATDTRVITRANSMRVNRFAFELARRRGRGSPKDGKMRVTCVGKDNVMEGCRLFRDVFYEVARDYPDVEAETWIVDSFTQRLIIEPERFDVVVTTNMFGDIVTDLASVLQGGMGMAVGCNVGDDHGMFEPIHGSAPDIAGKGKANPLAMILAIHEGLTWLATRIENESLTCAAAAIAQAVEDLLVAGAPLTADLVDADVAANTQEVGDAVAERVRALLGP